METQECCEATGKPSIFTNTHLRLIQYLYFLFFFDFDKTFGTLLKQELSILGDIKKTLLCFEATGKPTLFDFHTLAALIHQGGGTEVQNIKVNKTLEKLTKLYVQMEPRRAVPCASQAIYLFKKYSCSPKL